MAEDYMYNNPGGDLVEPSGNGIKNFLKKS